MNPGSEYPFSFHPVSLSHSKVERSRHPGASRYPVTSHRNSAMYVIPNAMSRVPTQFPSLQDHSMAQVGHHHIGVPWRPPGTWCAGATRSDPTLRHAMLHAEGVADRRASLETPGSEQHSPEPRKSLCAWQHRDPARYRNKSADTENCHLRCLEKSKQSAPGLDGTVIRSWGI